MEYRYLKEVIAEFKKVNNIYNQPVIGGSEEEIAALERFLPSGYSLPAAYREFLHFGGRGMGEIFGLFWFTFSTHEDGAPSYSYANHFSPDWLVFGQHLVEYRALFNLTAGDNPPVYSSFETLEGGFEPLKLESESFTAFLVKIIRSAERLGRSD